VAKAKKAAPPPPGRGRPSKFHDKVPEQAAKLSIAGWTDEQMAEFFEVGVATFNRWKVEHPEFRESLKRKGEADAEVEASLFNRARGYSHPDVHISNFQGQITITPIVKHYAPDPTACIFWLKNRQPDRWREKQDGNGITPEEAALEAQEAIAAASATSGSPR
jgi:hypothetical protein